MAEASSDLLLEIMRAVRSDISAMHEDARDVRHRLTAMELGLAGVRRELAILAETEAHIVAGADKMTDRIERRLDIVDA